MSRQLVVAANWKMNLLQADAAVWCRMLRSDLPAGSTSPTSPTSPTSRTSRTSRVLVFPSFPLLPVVARELAGSAIAVGGQDLHPEDKGAHTGDVSGAQLADAGCTWVLCGHSERRRDHGETDELVARKAAAALRHGLTPLVCVGETREERQAGAAFAVLERQLRSALTAVSSAGFAIAYEPVWAIGTGETATPETAQEAHRFLRGILQTAGGAEVSILYGGSVTPENAAALQTQPDVDGFLVGGASLDPQKFLGIIRASD